MKIDILEVDYSSKAPGNIYFKYQVVGKSKAPKIEYIWKRLDIDEWDSIEPYIKDALNYLGDFELNDMRDLFNEGKYY